MITRTIYGIAGGASLVLGVAGIFLPVLPTTPFILLAAWCFSRSSERLHNWLVSHVHLGPIIHAWQVEKSIPRRTRNGILLLLWMSLGFSAWLLAEPKWIMLLLALGLVPTVILLRIKVREIGRPGGE